MNNYNNKTLFFIVTIIIIIITILIYIFFINRNNKFNENASNSTKNNSLNENKNLWETRYVQIDDSQKKETPLIVKNKTWNQKEIYLKFNTVILNNCNYLSNESKIEEQYLGNFIQKEIITAFDEKNIEHTIFVDIYELKGISSQCAIAVNFENDGNYYIYININYNPQTLNDIIEDLNLKENISISSISYNYKYFDDMGIEKSDNIEFENIDKNDIFNILFEDLYIKNTYQESNLYQQYIMSIKGNIPLLCLNVYINITDDGFLTTNILKTEKSFNIGKNKCNEFINYITDNYTGYKIIYVNNSDESTIYPDDKILKIHNNIEY